MTNNDIQCYLSTSFLRFTEIAISKHLFHRAPLNKALTYSNFSIFVKREEVANMIVTLSKLSNQFRISTALVDPVLRRQSPPTDLLIASKVCQN